MWEKEQQAFSLCQIILFKRAKYIVRLRLIAWLVDWSTDWLTDCIWVQHHFNSYVHIMAIGGACVFPGFLTPELTRLIFPKPPTTFLPCFCRGERRKYTGKKSCLNRGSNSQPPGHESDILTTEPPGRGLSHNEIVVCKYL